MDPHRPGMIGHDDETGDDSLVHWRPFKKVYAFLLKTPLSKFVGNTTDGKFPKPHCTKPHSLNSSPRAITIVHALEHAQGATSLRKAYGSHMPDATESPEIRILDVGCGLEAEFDTEVPQAKGGSSTLHGVRPASRQVEDNDSTGSTGGL
ncbi:hypothetical protein EVAR_5798_1 [Eumeta japonica]|uniref:Uncharacterized protein n=1 Tax=Eumeta variegata TaxID=151549 RepID=A0A4C1T4C2_EUMVA|nr:hypothetical protein EVAR_5798_1 [Eumeta japonica]